MYTSFKILAPLAREAVTIIYTNKERWKKQKKS